MSMKNHVNRESRHEFELRRIRGVQMVLDGVALKEAAEKCDVSIAAVSQWCKAQKLGGWDALFMKIQPGPTRQFTQEHLDILAEIINHKPYFWGFKSQYWTSQMVREILRSKSGRWFSVSTIRRYMHKLGFHFRSRKRLLPSRKKKK